MSDRPRRGACSSTGKVCYPNRSAAKDHRRRAKMLDVSAYKCGDCGFFHLGGWHGIKDRAAHRSDTGVWTMTVEQAAATLAVSPEFIARLIESEKVRSHDGAPYREDIERIAAT